jgi:hypothetical protein
MRSAGNILDLGETMSAATEKKSLKRRREQELSDVTGARSSCSDYPSFGALTMAKIAARMLTTFVICV